MNSEVKIALIVPESELNINDTCVPYGLGAIAGYIRIHRPEWKIKIIDGMAGHDVITEIEKFKPDIVGVSFTTTMVYEAYALGRTLKEYYKVPVIFGGVHATAKPYEALERCDVVITDDGEITFIEIVEQFLDGFKPHGVVQGKEIQDIDFPYPWDLLDVEEYLKHGAWLPRLEHPVMNMVTSRGCPYRCPFCKNSTRATKVRYQSAERIVQDILYLHNKYGVTDFYFSDDEFLINTKRLKRLCGLFSKYGINKWIRWGCQARSQNMKLQTLMTAKSMGIEVISLGIESGSEKMLQIYKNGTTTVADHDIVIQWCEMLDIGIGGCTIYGHYSETLETMEESMNWAKSKLNIIHLGVQTLILFPGSKLYNEYIEKGFLPKKIDYTKLVPALGYANKTYYHLENIDKKVFEKKLLHYARMNWFYVRVNWKHSYKHFFFELSKTKKWWWAWLHHPREMFNLLKRIKQIKQRKRVNDQLYRSWRRTVKNPKGKTL